MAFKQKGILSGQLIPLAIGMATTFALGFYRIDFYSIWLDEYSTLAATETWRNLAAYLSAFPEQHPLYYLIIRGMCLNQSLLEIRLFSLLCGVVAILPFYYIGCRLFSIGTSKLACIMYALSPFILYYNQEGRTYSLFMLLALLQVAAFIQWTLDGSRLGKYAFACFSILSLYTHFFTFFLLAVEFLWLCAAWVRKRFSVRLAEGSAIFVIIGLAYIPWLAHILTHLGGMSQDWRNWLNIVLGIPYTYFRFIAGYGIFPLNHDLKTNLAAHLPHALLWVAVITLTYAPASVLSIRCFKRTTWGQRLAWALAFAPIVLVVAASSVKNVASERYVVYSAPFFYLVIASVWDVICPGRRFVKIVAVGLPLLLSTLGIGYHFFNPDFGKTDYKAVSSYLLESNESASQIVCIPAMVCGPLQYYLGNRLSVSSLPEWESRPSTSPIWVVERMANTGGGFVLKGEQFERISEKIFPRENGLRVTLWRYLNEQ